ncbi:MAG: CDP-diacylglycerol--glycerol-3-phosphate 3-phosphatidyltransferase [Bdellovibrionales bacterium]|nr:CDP-diacylglycerol--glycerol-3-phosphate 3-phosphatidyltransferase [Bdellovibrionales bacterium]
MFFTYLRIGFAPIIMAVIYIPWSYSGWVASGLFVIASATDWADGYYARKYSAQSVAGQFMDPIADKLLVLSAILMLLNMNRVDPVMVFLLIGRDIFIGGVRAIAATSQVIIAAKPFGKWKTALQMFAIPCLFVYDPIFGVIPLAKIGYVCLWVSVALSFISGVEYTWGYFKGKNKTESSFGDTTSSNQH